MERIHKAIIQYAKAQPDALLPAPCARDAAQQEVGR